MNLHTLLHDKDFGLYFPETNDYVRWIPSTAAESSVDIDLDSEEDFDVFLLSGIKADDYVVVRADAEVERVSEDVGKEHIAITDVEGVRRFFKVFKILTHDEIFS